MRQFVCIVILVASVAWFTGCGGGAKRPRLVEVKGKVTLNGAPLEGALIGMTLDPPDAEFKRPAQARSNSQGEFIPATYGDAKGIPTGKYKLTVTKQEFPEDYNAENPEASKGPITYVVPKVYSDLQTSGLFVEVTSGGMKPDVIELQGSPEVVRPGASRSSNEP